MEKKKKQRNFYSEFQSVLMQVAKSGIINKKEPQEKFQKFQENYKIINSRLIKNSLSKSKYSY